MTEGNTGSSSFSEHFRKVVEKVTGRESREYTFDKLWAQRKRKNALPLETTLTTPKGETISMGLRQLREQYTGRKYFVLGYFDKSNKPLGYFIAEKSFHSSSLFSDTSDRRKIAELSKDKIFGPLLETVARGETMFVKEDLRKRGMGRTFIETMLDIANREKAENLVLNNTSGYVERMVRRMEENGRITTKYFESSGAFHIQRQSPREIHQ